MKTNTRENIKGCFLELLEESPFSHITVKDIVERCAINRNTFYYYFQEFCLYPKNRCLSTLSKTPSMRSSPARWNTAKRH